MKTLNQLLLLACSLLLWCTSAGAQQLSNMGKDFWIGYGHHVRMANPSVPEQMQLYITSDVATTGKVSIKAIGFEQSFTVTPKQITTISIPRTAALTGDGLFQTGIHVTAEKPVVVYSFIFVSAVSGATVCLPTNTLGRDYYSVNFTQASNESNCSSYFFVVATDTGSTAVEITPSALTKGGKPAGVPFVVNLQQGQVYQVLGSVSGSRGVDLTGSRIRSVNAGAGCKKIAVFSGSSKMSIGCTNPNTSDNLYQQAYPTATWGQKYIALSSLRNSNNIFRIIRPDPTAIVKVNNQVVPATAFTNNFYYQFQGNANYVIESDKAILVAQYFSTQRCMGNNEQGDPEMIFLNPVNQTLESVTLNSMQPQGVNIRDHYLNIVVPNTPNALASFRMDGAPWHGFQPLQSDPAYAYARITTAKGTHNLTCDTGFNVIAYGFGEAESYGYSGGARLRNLYQYGSVQNEYATLDYAATCATAPFRLSITLPYQAQGIKWRFGGALPDVSLQQPRPDSTWRINGQNVYRYTIPGWMHAPAEGSYTVRLTVFNALGDGCTNEQEIEHELVVHPKAKAAFTLQTNGCLGDAVVLREGYTQGNRLAPATWLWNLGNGQRSNQEAPTPVYSTWGSFPVSLAVINEIGVITDTAVRAANISPLPQNDFTVAGPFCVGRSFGVIPKATIASGSIAQYQWSTSDGVAFTKGAGQAFAYSFGVAGTYSLSLNVISDKGCRGTPVQHTIKTGVVPKAAFSIPSSCLKDPYSQFWDSSSVAGNVPLRYNWHFGDSLQPEANSDKVQHPKHRYAAPGSFRVTMAVSTQDGCADTLVQTIRVNGALPVAQFDLQNGLRQCSDKSVVLTNEARVDLGRLEKLELYWDYAGDRTNKVIDELPTVGKQYSFEPGKFYTPEQKAYTIRMVAYSGQSCYDTLEKTVMLDALPQLNTEPLPLACTNDRPFPLTQFKIQNGLSGTGSFSGQAVNFEGMFEPRKAIVGVNKVQYRFTSQWGCSQELVQTVLLAQSPKVNAGPDLMVRRGRSEMIRASSTGANLTYRWSPAAGLSNPTLLQPVVHPLQDEVYTLTATSAEGCTATDEMKVQAPDNVYIPNSFTPNRDGLNDCWRVPFLMASDEPVVQVFSRDGVCVYRNKGLANWDGTYKNTPQPTGTYVYLIQLENSGQIFKGTITLVR